MLMREHTCVQSTMCTTGAYAVESASKACSSDTILASISECRIAKAVIDANAADVVTEHYSDTPKGCSRHKGKWYYNTHATGALDGTSEPVCKAVLGNVTACMSWLALHLIGYYTLVSLALQASYACMYRTCVCGVQIGKVFLFAVFAHDCTICKRQEYSVKNTNT